MQIKGIHLNPINPYNKAQRTAQVKQSSANFNDTLEISSVAKDMRFTSEYKEQRAERVQELKAAIESNTYQVDARKVAEDMLKYYRF